MTIEPTLAVITTVLSVFSGTASYLQGRRDGRLKSGWLDASAELVTAPVAGWSVFFMGMWQQWSEPLVCLFVLVAAINGSWFLNRLKNGLLSNLTNKNQ